MKRTITTSLTALIAFLLVGSAWAQPSRFDRPGKGPGRADGPRQGRSFHPDRIPLRRLARALELSDEQIEQVRQLKQEAKEAAKPLGQQRRALRAELRELLEQESPSASEVGEKVLTIRSVSQEIRQVGADFVAAFEGILTPEQLEKLQELKDRRHPGHRGMRGERRHEG